MKLLSWMHQKLQKDAKSSLQASILLENSCTCFLATPSKDTKQIWQQKPCFPDHLEKHNPESTEEFNEEQSTDIFPGFLTIGTLSVEPISDPPTPTFDMTDDAALIEMNYDLKLINDELEKFLKGEAEKEDSTESSRRNSLASTITLNDGVKEFVSDEFSVKNQMYPLQGYLLGSSIEPLVKWPKEEKEKVSFYGFFKKSIIIGKSSIQVTERAKKEDTTNIKSSNHIKNKMKQQKQATPGISNHSDGRADGSFLNIRKLKKIDRIFNKKIHPDISKAEAATKELKSNKGETNKNLNSSYSYGESTIGCWSALKKGKKNSSKTRMMHNQNESTELISDHVLEDTNGGAGGEHWTTDDEYFVLELHQEMGVLT